MNPPGPLLAIVGPTATGKTEASVEVAEALGAEIVCLDSMLVYRGMDIGTAKPSASYRARVPHHMVDVADPEEPFSVAGFQQMATKAIAGIARRKAPCLVVGGGGLYYRAVVDGLRFPETEPRTRRLLEAEAAAVGPAVMHRRLAMVDPVAAERIEPGNVRRQVRALEVAAVTGRRFSSYATSWARYPPARVRAAGIDVPRTVLNRRIEARVRAMLPGLVEETRSLVGRGFERFLTSSRAIGYAEAVAFLRGAIGEDRLASECVRRTKALARRQLAWLRRDPRIRWFRAPEGGAPAVVPELIRYLDIRGAAQSRLTG